MAKSVQKITLGEESAATGYETAGADSEPPADDAQTRRRRAFVLLGTDHVTQAKCKP